MAGVGEALAAVDGAGRRRDEERLDADVLVVAGVVALVELVAAAELAADGVPEQLHQLDALDRVVAAGAADVLVDVRAQLRVLEVLGVRVQVDQAAADALLDDLLDARVAGRQNDR